MATSSKTAAAGKQAKKKVNISDQNLLLIITIVIFLVMYLGAIIFLGGGFRNAQNLFNILMQQSALIITACGMSLVMITGGIDISVGGVVALVCMSCAVCLDYMGGNVPLSILVALGIGLAYGVVQGFLVAYLEIQPFIISLAGMFFARGMTTIVHSQPFNVENEAFQALKTKSVLVIDEAQDMTEDEFNLITALIDKNETLKVIAVGDDDQNIYSFRKSDSKYMQYLISKYQARFYELYENFRSKSNLVTFANSFVNQIPHRMKHNPIVSHQPENGSLRITYYPSNNLIIPLIKDVVESPLAGTTGVLTKTNEEAVFISCLLQEQGSF